MIVITLETLDSCPEQQADSAESEPLSADLKMHKNDLEQASVYFLIRILVTL